jgi:outer membrane protein TolC
LLHYRQSGDAPNDVIPLQIWLTISQSLTKRQRMKCHRILLFGLALGRALAAAGPAPAHPAVVERCVAQAWASNLALRREALDVDTARAKLEAARGLYWPRLDFAARYSRADGGRTFDIPVGDMLNPVYSTLNQMLGTDKFPAVSNESLPLLRERDQETKLQLLQPLYRPEIARGVDAARATVASREAALAAFRRELRLEVERAYYRWFQAGRAVDVLAAAQGLVDEALRVNRSLAANGTETEDAVLRATAEVGAVRQQSAAAEADRDLAQSYLNFLLNRPADTPVEEAPASELDAMNRSVRAFAAEGTGATGRREELAALEAAVRAAEAGERAARAAQGPTVSLAVESGIQGESYRIDHNSTYALGSLVADLNLFDGNQNRSRIREAANARRQLASQTEEVARRIAMQERDARRRLAAAITSLDAAELRLAAARGAFDVVVRREREGLVNQLGFLDARNSLTSAELNHAMARAALFIAYAELDRSLALNPLS